MDYEQLSTDDQIIKKYQEDEQIMVQLFVQWCINHELNAFELYAKAYPEQQRNTALEKVIKEMDEFEVLEIDDETMLDVLQLFGNIDLAFIVSAEIEKFSKS